MKQSLGFVPPCQPVLRTTLPRGPAWRAEVKFDGYRIQAHRCASGAALFSRNGFSFNARFQGLSLALRELPAKSAIIDGEVVALSSAGLPEFRSLHSRAAAPESICLWAFDLLHLDGKDLRDLPLARRRQKLRRLIERFGFPLVRFSETFDDAAALLRSCEAHQLEGIVIKRQDAPYRSGPQKDWVKIKTTAWREANRERWRMFEGAH